MSYFIGMVGATFGGSVGWWLGDKVGMGTAIILSAVGSGVGFYFLKKIVRDMTGR